MRFPWQGLVIVILFIILTDISLLFYRRLQKGKFTHSKLFDLLFFILTPVVFIGAFVTFYIAVPLTDSAQLYYRFGWFLIGFLILYTPKFVWGMWNMTVFGVIYLLDDKKAGFQGGKIENEKIDKVPFPTITRKKFLSQIGIILATAPVLTLVFGAFKGRFNFFARYQKLSYPNLPAAFDGFRIVQISDLHLGSFNSNFEIMNEVVDLINAEHPDIIVFTGDLVNNFYQETIGWSKVFKRLKAKNGLYSILGNHDYGYYSKWNSEKSKQDNFKRIVESHEDMGFKLLRNENVKISRDNQEIAIAGVEYWGTSGRYPNTGDLNKSLRGIEDVPFSILMTHDPDHWDAQVVGNTSFDLSLSGHTHGMQFGIEYKGFKWSPAKYKFKRWDGLYKVKNQFLFVNRGLGVLGMPARVGMSPEITVIDLSKGPLGTEPM